MASPDGCDPVASSQLRGGKTDGLTRESSATPRTRVTLQPTASEFGLGTEAGGRRSSSLSPGERTRAELAAFAALGVIFPVLDEPTNHLDLPAIEQLESALQEYGGTLLLVSHDRRLPQTGTVTRHVELPGGHDESRGLRKF